ncbi:hypothetical protein [Cohnella caldifontis]|uniref:hypothetical protein n=1 Tax=Cohnella caldifontis TaxID=3027471 RepID=UPI0023EB5994|nr:hypothetical protein [Cohnella sp. YIM B05605]
MIRKRREWEIKLHLLESIARSQRALASMLESAAEVTAAAGLPPTLLHEHIRALDRMQAALLRAATGTAWRPPKRGAPAPPWLRQGVRSVWREDGRGA